MLVYKTTEKNNTKFYGVQNNEFFAEDLINDYENAENAGFINFDYSNSNDIKKLIDLTVENINTMRQAFEVYSILNDQSLKDTRKDFRDEMELHCTDDKPEKYYRVATLDDFTDYMFDYINPGYWELNSLLEWLENNVNDFKYTSIWGYSKGEETAFYKFNSSDDGVAYLPLDEESLMTVYGGAIDIEELEKDEQGHALTESNGNYTELVPELYVNEHGYNNEYVDEYMKEHYNAVPAEKEVTYF